MNNVTKNMRSTANVLQRYSTFLNDLIEKEKRDPKGENPSTSASDYVGTKYYYLNKGTLNSLPKMHPKSRKVLQALKAENLLFDDKYTLPVTTLSKPENRHRLKSKYGLKDKQIDFFIKDMTRSGVIQTLSDREWLLNQMIRIRYNINERSKNITPAIESSAAILALPEPMKPFSMGCFVARTTNNRLKGSWVLRLAQLLEKSFLVTPSAIASKILKSTSNQIDFASIVSHLDPVELKGLINQHRAFSMRKSHEMSILRLASLFNHMEPKDRNRIIKFMVNYSHIDPDKISEIDKGIAAATLKHGDMLLKIGSSQQNPIIFNLCKKMFVPNWNTSPPSKAKQTIYFPNFTSIKATKVLFNKEVKKLFSYTQNNAWPKLEYTKQDAQSLFRLFGRTSPETTSILAWWIDEAVQQKKQSKEGLCAMLDYLGTISPQKLGNLFLGITKLP
jgi:hypothetical protein